MIVVSIGMIYGKSKAGNANGNDRTYIEESEKNAKQKKAEKSENDSTGSAKQDSTVKTKMTEQRYRAPKQKQLPRQKLSRHPSSRDSIR